MGGKKSFALRQRDFTSESGRNAWRLHPTSHQPEAEQEVDTNDRQAIDVAVSAADCSWGCRGVRSWGVRRRRPPTRLTLSSISV